MTTTVSSPGSIAMPKIITLNKSSAAGGPVPKSMDYTYRPLVISTSCFVSGIPRSHALLLHMEARLETFLHTVKETVVLIQLHEKSMLYWEDEALSWKKRHL
jgi:hypothetical protein